MCGIDAYSRFTWIYLLKRKSDVFDAFLQFQRHVERLLKEKIVYVQSDWGGEYRNLSSFFQKHGIAHRVACPHTHQQNGVAERKHRHIVETGITFLARASVPFRFWSDAFVTTCFLINRLPTRLLNMKTPVELLFHEPPDYTFLKVFGCACWPHLRPYNSLKLEFRSKQCVFLGYSSMHKGYKCLHIPSNRVYISRDVVFDENMFPFAPPVPPVSTNQPLVSSPTLPGQFDDVAYSPVLLPNHGAGVGRGARLELLDDSPLASPAAHVHVDPAAPCMAHATPSVAVLLPAHAPERAAAPGTSSPPAGSRPASPSPGPSPPPGSPTATSATSSPASSAGPLASPTGPPCSSLPLSPVPPPPAASSPATESPAASPLVTTAPPPPCLHLCSLDLTPVVRVEFLAPRSALMGLLLGLARVCLKQLRILLLSLVTTLQQCRFLIGVKLWTSSIRLFSRIKHDP